MNDITLPPLPKPHAHVDIFGHDCPHHTREQMRAYARQAVLSERERCAQIAEEERIPFGDGAATWNDACDSIARLIRGVKT